METLALALDGRGVARVTLARAARHNALSAAMIAELTEAAARLAAVGVMVCAEGTGAARRGAACGGGSLTCGCQHPQGCSARAGEGMPVFVV